MPSAQTRQTDLSHALLLFFLPMPSLSTTPFTHLTLRPVPILAPRSLSTPTTSSPLPLPGCASSGEMTCVREPCDAGRDCMRVVVRPPPLWLPPAEGGPGEVERVALGSVLGGGMYLGGSWR